MHKAPLRRRYIALYIPTLEGGGAERVMVMLANSLSAMGHRIDLVLMRAAGPYLSEVAETVQIVDLHSSRTLLSVFPLLRYLRRARPDVMLSALGHSNIVAILARKLAHIPIRLVISEHISLLKGSNGMVRILMRCLYPTADAIVCVSNGIQKEIIENLNLAPEKVHRVYNPLDVDRILNMKNVLVDHLWFSSHTHPVILAIGRLTKQKDYSNLLKAFAHLLKKRSARLFILGEGEDEVMLKCLTKDLAIEKYVAFMGFQANPFAWMNACDLFVLSSCWEGLPGVLLEALVCNTRIVSTNCPTGPSEILEEGRWGRLVPVGDPDALATAMQSALDDLTPLDGIHRAEMFRLEYATMEYARIMNL